MSGCWSQGKTQEEALSNIREAIQLWLEAAKEELKKHGIDALTVTNDLSKQDQIPALVETVVKHYGVKTLLYGTLFPGPDIGRRAGHVMRSVRDEGFDVGVHCWDHVKWQDGLDGASVEPAVAEGASVAVRVGVAVFIVLYLCLCSSGGGAFIYFQF